MRKITIEVNVPECFDDVEDRWEMEQAAQEWVNEIYRNEIYSERVEDVVVMDGLL